MGALAEAGDDVTPSPAASLTGEGKRLVEWWLEKADDDDRRTLRRWVDAGLSQHDIADRITATGFPISRATVHKGIRLLRRAQWAP